MGLLSGKPDLILGLRGNEPFIQIVSIVGLIYQEDCKDKAILFCCVGFTRS